MDDERDPTVARGECPVCHNEGLVPIMYGMPADDPSEDVRAGRYMIGGCCITGDDPNRECIDCGASVYADGRFERPSSEDWEQR
jgi:hypothetical protein